MVNKGITPTDPFKPALFLRDDIVVAILSCRFEACFEARNIRPPKLFIKSTYFYV